MGATRKDETGFFTASDDFDGVPESFFGSRQEVGRVRCNAQRLRADGTNVLRINALELFTETA